MQSETFGREMWGGGIDEKEPSNPFLQKRSLRVPWHGRPPPPPPRATALRTCSRLDALGPTGCHGLMVNGLTVIMKAKARNFC